MKSGRVTGMARATARQKKQSPMKKFPSEGSIQRNIIQLLDIKHIPHARINSGSIFTGKYMVKLAPEGFPDLLFFHRGVSHAIEVKKVGEVLRPLQLTWFEILTRSGFSYAVVTSVDQFNEYLPRFEAEQGR